MFILHNLRHALLKVKDQQTRVVDRPDTILQWRFGRIEEVQQFHLEMIFASYDVISKCQQKDSLVRWPVELPPGNVKHL